MIVCFVNMWNLKFVIFLHMQKKAGYTNPTFNNILLHL